MTLGMRDQGQNQNHGLLQSSIFVSPHRRARRASQLITLTIFENRDAKNGRQRMPLTPPNVGAEQQRELNCTS